MRTVYVPGGSRTPSRPTVGALRPSSGTLYHCAYSGLVRSFACFVRSPRKFHQTRFRPAFFGALIVRTTAPLASAIVSAMESLLTSFVPALSRTVLSLPVLR